MTLVEIEAAHDRVDNRLASGMKREHVDAVMESSRVATALLLSKRGSKLFRHSGIHYLELR